MSEKLRIIELDKMRIFPTVITIMIFSYLENDNIEIEIPIDNFNGYSFAIRILSDRLYVIKRDKFQKYELETTIFSKNRKLYQAYAIKKYFVEDITERKLISNDCAEWVPCTLDYVNSLIKNKQKIDMKEFTLTFKYELLSELLVFFRAYDAAHICFKNQVYITKLIMIIEYLLTCDYTTKKDGDTERYGYAVFQLYNQHGNGMIERGKKILNFNKRSIQYDKICRQLYYEWEGMDKHIIKLIKKNRKLGKTIVLTNNGGNWSEEIVFNGEFFNRKMYFFDRNELLQLKNELKTITKFMDGYISE